MVSIATSDVTRAIDKGSNPVDAGTILIVEDNPKLNKMFRKQLTANGYNCAGAAGVKDAIKHVENAGVPSLIVLDLELNDGYGTDFLQYLQENDIQTRIVVVSANAYSRSVPDYDYPVDQVLLKPISPRGLAALIKDTI